MYSQDILEQIKSQINIVDVVSKYVTLKKVGRNYQGLCPFHSERTPSFFVNPELNIFKCFGCGIGGDIFKFVQEIEKVNFGQAVEKLAKQAGIELPKSKEATIKYIKRKKILRVLDIYSKFYHKLLLSSIGKNALSYILKRGLSIEDIKKYRLGYAPSDSNIIIKFSKLMKISIQDLVDAGLLTEDKLPRFKYRLMFPLFDISGNVVGFSGRTLSQSSGVPKYLNTPETLVFKKRYFLFGLYWAKQFISKNDLVILTEGQMDVLSSFRADVFNIVAPLGTALTETQLILLKRFTNKIAFAFDNDFAGQKALFRSVILAIKQGFIPYVINFADISQLSPNNKDINIKDIDELIKIDPHLWQRLVKRPKEFFEFQIQKIKNIQLNNYIQVEQDVDILLEILSYADNLRQEIVIKKLASELDISIESLKQRFEHIKEKIKGVGLVVANPVTHNKSYSGNVYNNIDINETNSENLDEKMQQSIDDLPNVRLTALKDNLEKYITSIIIHYPVITFIKDFFSEYQELFYDPIYKAIIELSKKAMLFFLKQQSKEIIKQAQNSLLDFNYLFIQRQGNKVYSNYMTSYLRETNFYNTFIELAALEPPFSVLDKNTLKDFLYTWKRFRQITYKLNIKRILEELDEIDKQKGAKDKFLINKLNKQLKKYTNKLQQLNDLNK